MTFLAELVIQNARLVLPEGIVEGGLAIDNGRITEISKSNLPSGDREINAGGSLSYLALSMRTLTSTTRIILIERIFKPARPRLPLEA